MPAKHFAGSVQLSPAFALSARTSFRPSAEATTAEAGITYRDSFSSSVGLRRPGPSSTS